MEDAFIVLFDCNILQTPFSFNLLGISLKGLLLYSINHMHSLNFCVAEVDFLLLFNIFVKKFYHIYSLQHVLAYV